MGGRGKGKEMRGFFAVEQAPSPNAAHVLVSEAKLFLWSYRESYETALLEKKGTVKIPVCECLSGFYFGSSYSLKLVKYLTHSRCSKMSDERMKKYGSPMGSAHVESNPIGTSRQTHFNWPFRLRCCVCMYLVHQCIKWCFIWMKTFWNLEESFNQVSLSHLNKISYLILYLFSYRSQVKDLM